MCRNDIDSWLFNRSSSAALEIAEISSGTCGGKCWMKRVESGVTGKGKSVAAPPNFHPPKFPQIPSTVARHSASASWDLHQWAKQIPQFCNTINWKPPYFLSPTPVSHHGKRHQVRERAHSQICGA